MDNDFQLKIEGTTVVGYTGNAPWALVIPEGITAIGYEAFLEAMTLRTVIIPSSIQVIDRLAFHECVRLFTVVLPNVEFTLDATAFEKCVSLRSLEIPDKVKVLGDFTYYAFNEDAVDVPEYVTNIGWAGCRSPFVHDCNANLISTVLHCNFFNCHVIRFYDHRRWNFSINEMFRYCGRIEFCSYETGDVIQCAWIGGHDAKRWGKWGVHQYLTEHLALEYGQLDFHRYGYDSFVPTLRLVRDKGLAMLYRLTYPKDLYDADEELFVDYLWKNKKKVMEHVVWNDDPALLRVANDIGLITNRNRDYLIQHADTNGSALMARMLIEGAWDEPQVRRGIARKAEQRLIA